jgi:hypothetical protein
MTPEGMKEEEGLEMLTRRKSPKKPTPSKVAP